MTPSELLALVGRAWVRLFLYPGGLSLFAVAWFAFYFAPTFLRRKGHEERDDSKSRSRTTRTIAAPWLAVALLPFPGTVDLGRGIDVVVVLSLLDVPLFLAIERELGSAITREHGAKRLAAALNGYPPLLLATLLLAANGSLDVGQLVQPPALSSVNGMLHWIGAIGLVVALPPVIGFGPFAVPTTQHTLPLQVRAVGFWALASLPFMAPLEQWWQVLPPLVLVIVLWVFHRATRKQTPRRWAQGYGVLSLALLVVLVAGATWQLAARLQ